VIYLLRKEAVAIKEKVKTWDEAVRKAGELLYDIGAVEKSYIENMVKIVEDLGPYIVIAPGIALAHARPEHGVRENGLSLVTLKNPVYFGNPDNDPVEIVIGLAAAADSDHTELLSRIAESFSREEFKEFLIRVQDVEELFKRGEKSET